MPEKVQFDSPWNVETIQGALEDVATAKGTSASLTAKLATLANADMSNVTLDGTPASESTHPFTSGGAYTYINQLQRLAGIRNVLQCKAETITDYGVTFTIDDDGRILANGTSAPTGGVHYSRCVLTLPGQGDPANRLYSNAIPIPPGTYKIPPIITQSGILFLAVRVYTDADTSTDVMVYTTEQSFTVTGENAKIHAMIAVEEDKTVTNLRLEPRICMSSALDMSFTPFIPTNFFLMKQGGAS